ncbi:hypothetical protein GCM10023160_02830 [Brachybacterium paraconglomeratum]
MKDLPEDLGNGLSHLRPEARQAATGGAAMVAAADTRAAAISREDQPFGGSTELTPCHNLGA